MPPSPSLILLGASNLSLGFPEIIRVARHTLGTPLMLYGSLGHGRSYGKPSRVLGRGLPGIRECGLWPVLRENNPQQPLYALITDIGNDIMYGYSPEMITDWVGACVERLELLGASIVMTGLPLDSLRKLTPSKYRMVKSLFFPHGNLSFTDAMSRIEELDQRLELLVQTHHLKLHNFPESLYGWDPIHIRKKHRLSAWSSLFETWNSPAPGQADTPSPESMSKNYAPEHELTRFDYLILRTRTPQNWTLFGFARGRSQPSARFRDGTTLFLY